jgi:group I intron endonuclease
MKGYVYLVTNLVNGKKYVGYTTRTIAKRWKEHLTLAARGSLLYFHCALRKYGLDNFRVELLETVVGTQVEIQAAEVRYIASQGSLAPDGYNLTVGGEGTHDFSVNARERVAAAQRGRPRSEELRRKVSLALKGRPKPEGFGEKLSKAQIGKPRPWQRGRPRSEETRQRIAASRTGQPMPASVRQKLLDSHKGVPMPAEWRQNISDGLKRRSNPDA